MPDNPPIVTESPGEFLVHAWQLVLQQTPAEATQLLHELSQDLPYTLARVFYSTLMEDPRSNRFLDHDQVRERLQPALQRWLVQLLNASIAEVPELIQKQSVIGDVHARVGIPVDLVLRGMRVLKGHLLEAIADSGRPAAVTRKAATCLHNAMDIATEGMTLAYANSRDRASRADSAYRLFSVIRNITAERERQRALLLDWENHLLYALACPSGIHDLQPLKSSEFGLWFTHKGIPTFGNSSETRHTQELMAEVDQMLRQAAGSPTVDMPRLLLGIRQHVEQIRHLQGMLFERMSKLDSGSDSLTSLLNRRFLPTVLRREIELSASTGSSFAVLLIDLDHFKSINDQHGHDTGDRALQLVASLLSQHTRGSDYLFRYGGEEFVAVVVGVTELQAMVIAENLRELIANNPLALRDNNELPLTASIGVALFDGHPDYAHLMNRADEAMYAAKRGGRNQVQVAP